MTADDGEGTGAGDERPLLIGLTGPIGCGKSTVAGWLAEDGAVVVDADAIARDVTAPGEVGHDAVLAAFGEGFRRPDGSLDRAALGRRVFSDPAALGRLEKVVHPLVRPRILWAIENARLSGTKVVALEAIKLVESGYAAMCDEVWLITCPADDQLERLVARGMTRSDVRQRTRAQAGMSERLARAASRIVDTAGPPDETRSLINQALADALARRAMARRAQRAP